MGLWANIFSKRLQDMQLTREQYGVGLFYFSFFWVIDSQTLPKRPNYGWILCADCWTRAFYIAKYTRTYYRWRSTFLLKWLIAEMGSFLSHVQSNICQISHVQSNICQISEFQLVKVFFTVYFAISLDDICNAFIAFLIIIIIFPPPVRDLKLKLWQFSVQLFVCQLAIL